MGKFAIKIGKSGSEQGVLDRFSAHQSSNINPLYCMGYIEGNEKDIIKKMAGFIADIRKLRMELKDGRVEDKS